MFKQSKKHLFGELSPTYSDTSSMHIRKRKKQDGMGLSRHVLLIDNEIVAREQLKLFYTSNGYRVETAGSVEDALNRVNNKDIDLVVVDSDLPEIGGPEVIAKFHRNDPRTAVIMTGYSSDDDNHDCNLGICDYMSKPFSFEGIQQATQAALEKAYILSESRNLQQSLVDVEGEFGLLLSKTPAMHQIFESIRMVAPTNMTVLLEGEAGTGKELIANAIHYKSSRRSRPFIPVNCAGYPESLLETELFGCEEGRSFSKEVKRPGKIKLADGGTLFLDEIEGMAPFVQSKFMRVLEDCNTVHLGRRQTVDIDVRVIAASNVRLEDLVEQGKMRPDLYYRINVVPIHLLPLRERADDIPLLVDEFLRRHRIAKQKGITSVSRDTLSRLIQYPWPGNLRELQNVLEKAVVLSKGSGSVIDVIDLPSAKIPDH